MSELIELARFSIEFKERQYECIGYLKNSRKLYQIKFPNSYLYLTEATARSGEKFWTSIPQDPKLNHIIPALAKQIEYTQKSFLCVTTQEEEFPKTNMMS